MKKLFVLLIALVCIFGVSSCGEKKTNVYIIQYVSATALDEAKDGIIQGLKENGFDEKNCEITVLNPQAKSDTLQQMVSTAVSKADIIFAIATPVAIAVKGEVEKMGKETPVFFTAVTDPVASGILTDAKNPGCNISGTTDLNPVAKQIEFIKTFNPEASKVGFIYTAGESNSVIQLNLAKEACKNNGFTLYDGACTTASDISQVLSSLLGNGIDVLYIPTDNEIAANMQLVASTCNARGVVTVCGEAGQVNDGGTLTIGSVNYVELGKMTGKMGADALNGADVSKMAVKDWSSEEVLVNKEAVSTYSLNVAQSVIDQSK